MKDSTKKERRASGRRELAPVIGLACLAIVLFGALCAYTKVDPVFTGVCIAFLYAGVVAIFGAVRGRRQSVRDSEQLAGIFGSDLANVASRMTSPAFLTDDRGAILWCNGAMAEQSGRTDLAEGVLISDVCSLPDVSDGEEHRVTMAGRVYRYEGIRMERKDRRYWLAFLYDCTDFDRISAAYENERTALAYVVIDNMDELTQYVQDKYRTAEATVEEKLKEWVSSIDGILKSFEHDKFVMLLEEEKLKTCIERRFAILDAIRSIRVEGGASITVSMGISHVGGTLAEREAAAQAALDLALQRGGDQVAVKDEEGVTFYGGRTKAVTKRSNVRARVIGNELISLMRSAGNVLVMGHRFCDFDSIGSAVGIAALAASCSVDVHIVINPADANFRVCRERLRECSRYDGVFVDAIAGQDLVGPDTLLVITDVSNPENVEAPDIARNVFNTVVIDHHRKTGEFAYQPRISYIEPSASSASELVTEILEQNLPAGTLLKEEADLLLSGIILDTQQFLRNTGTRTFGAAQYLRNEGAMPRDAQELFKTDIDDIAREARFHSNVRIYRDVIAISMCDGETDEGYRVAAARAADRLLAVRGVEAAFTIVPIGERVHISGRSTGKINVQLILEQLNGGGHYDVAGAAIEGENVIRVGAMLKAAIDHYFESTN